MSVSEWREVKLGDVCTYASAKVSVSEVNENNYISTENMLPNKSGVKKSSGLPIVSSVTKYSAGNVLVSNIRPYFRKIWYADRDGGCSNDVLVFKVNDSQKLDSRFLFYCLSNDVFFDYVMAGAKGTKMPRGDKSAIFKYPVPLPHLPEQKAIAATLSALDDMIELNNQINKTLEEMAQAIFKSWFVDFEPFKDGGFEESELGLIPKGWKVGTLGEAAVFKNGVNYGREQKGEAIKIVNVRNFDGSSIIVCDDTLDEIKLPQKQITDYLLKPNDTIIVRSAKPGETMFVASKVDKVYSGFTIRIRPIEKDNGIFIFYSVRNMMKEIENSSNGTIFKNLNQQILSNIKILIPDIMTIIKFNNFIRPFIKGIQSTTDEIKLLHYIRDTILPKLMSGEIRVPVEEVV